MEPQIIIQSNIGHHNSSNASRKRIEKSKTYQDLSTICIIPTRGVIPAKVVQYWMAMYPVMNQKFTRVFAFGMEVGAAYSEAVETILKDRELSKWKYILFLEEDNAPPPDGLLMLYESIDKYDAVGGLYWTKGIGGQPMCYGKVTEYPVNFIPFTPAINEIAQCRGLGMGFTLCKMSMFKDKRLKKPFFKTGPGYTQDLKFFEEAGKLGYKFACDSRVKVGHYDLEGDYMW